MLQAVIMAAGKSTRTYPLTLTKPKPLLRIANKPILAHQLDLFVGLIEEAVLIVGYKHDLIRAEFGESYRDIALRYVEQRELLGTGHAAMQVAPHIKDRFVLMNGDDLYAKSDLDALLRHQYALLSQEVEDPRLYGVLTVRNGLVKDVIEMPDNPASKYLAAKDMRTVDHWTKLCAQLQHQGVMHQALDAKRTAMQILALWQGLVQAYLRDDSFDADTMHDLFMDGMRHLTCRNWQEFLTYLSRPDVGI